MIKIFPRMELKSCEDCPCCTEEYESCKPDFKKCNHPESYVYSICTVYHLERVKERNELVPFPDRCPLRTKYKRRKKD